MSRYLIVANQTLGGAELEHAVTDRIQRGDSEFHVLVPMVEPAHEATSWVPADPLLGVPAPGATEARVEAKEQARQRSEQRLRVMIDRITSLGGRADGEIGDTDPFRAVERVLQRDTFDEVIISTLPAGLSRWIKMDLPSRVERATETPVTTVEAEQ